MKERHPLDVFIAEKDAEIQRLLAKIEQLRGN